MESASLVRPEKVCPRNCFDPPVFLFMLCQGCVFTTNLILVETVSSITSHYAVLCLTEVFGPSRLLQLAGGDMKGARFCVYIVAVLCFVLFYLCDLWVLEFGTWLWSATRSGQAKVENSQARPSAWEAIQASLVTWWVGRPSLLWERSKHGLICCCADND